MSARFDAHASARPKWTHVNPRVSADALAQYRMHATEQELVVFANSSMDAQVAWRVFRAFAFFCICICAFSVAQGNIGAPLFLLLNGALVMLALRSVQRRCQAHDQVLVQGADLIGRQIRFTQQAEVVFPLAWVQLMVEHPGAECRTYLRARGEWMEIGSFLNREQRERLAEQLKTFLDLAKARAVSTL